MTNAGVSPSPPPGSRRIGLMAGWGRYPVVVAEALVAQGYEVYCLGVREHADAAALAPHCVRYEPVGIAHLGRALRFFLRHDVHRAVMAGKIHKTTMYHPWKWLKYRPDWWSIRLFFHSFVTARDDRRDDSILGAVVRAFAAAGVTFAPATDFAPELLVKHGYLTRRRPTAVEQKDVEFGWRLAKAMGRLDVGQSVAVKDRSVLAVEAIEGTDACIARAGELCRRGGFTLVKVAKPQQDMRFDVPAVGVGTIRRMIEAGARCLAVEADKTIFIDHDEVVRLADEHRLAIVALHAADELPADVDATAECETRAA